MVSALRTRLKGSLFPSSPRNDHAVRGVGLAAVVTTLMALAIALQILRVGTPGSLNTLWAEDGQIFLQEALDQSFWHAIFATYAGYLVLVPRLIGELASAVPLRDAPAAIAVSSGLVVALSGLAVWYASAAHIRNPFLRGTLVALTVLSPVAALESVASGAYVPWYMLFATFWLLLWRPASTRGAVFGALFILATGLSSPGVWFFAPLAALRALAARDRRDLLLVGSFAIGAAIQVPVILLNTEQAIEPAWTSDIWVAYAQRIVSGAAFGERAGGVAWAHLGWPFLIAVLVCAAAGLAFGLKRSGPMARWLAAIAIPTSLVMFVVSVYQRAVGSQMIWPGGSHVGGGGRYTIVPALLLVSVALVLLDQLTPPQRVPRFPWVTAAAVTILLMGMAVSFRVGDMAIRGTPPWDDALANSASSCVGNRLADVTVPISPPGFGIAISCKSTP